MLDVGPNGRSIVTGIEEPKELAFGEKILFVKEGTRSERLLFRYAVTTGKSSLPRTPISILVTATLY